MLMYHKTQKKINKRKHLSMIKILILLIIKFERCYKMLLNMRKMYLRMLMI